VEKFPLTTPRRAVPLARIAVGVVDRSGRVLITRRAESAMLGGLWEFPGGKIRAGESAEAACRREIREETGLDVDVVERVAKVQHAYSHLKVKIDVFRCAYRGGRVQLKGPVDHRWILLEETGQYAFPKANHKFIPVLKGGTATAKKPRRKAAPRRPA
jgi:A/G-specific adenine glycosylase